MDPLTLVLAILTSLSEILPLLGIQANGLIHGLHCIFVHLSADSQCHVEVDVEARSPVQSPQREQAELPVQSTTIALSSSSAGGAATAATAGAAPGAAAGPAAIAAFEAAPP